MKAVFLLQTDPFSPRPALRALREADALARVGWSVMFVAWIKAPAPPAGGPPDVYPVRRIAVPVPPVGSSIVGRWRAYRRAMDELASTARSERPDLIIVHDFETLRAAVDVRRRDRIPLIYDAHEDYPSVAAENSVLEARIAAWEERRLCRRVDHVVTVSEPLAEKYRAWGRPATVLYSSRSSSEIQLADRGESRRRFGYGEDDFVVGFTGALAPARGLDILIDALASTSPVVKALIVGGPDAEVERLKARAAAASLSPRVRIEGHRPYAELAPYYAAMDVGAMLLEPRYIPRPRRAGRDGGRPLSLQTAGNLSNKLFDYIAHGLPLLVPAYPAMAALVESGRCGWTIPQVDAPNVSTKLEEIRRSGEAASRGRNGQLKFQDQFAWERQEAAFLGIVSPLAKPTAPRT